MFWSDKIPINRIKNEKKKKKLLSFTKIIEDIYKNIPPDKGILLFILNFFIQNII